MPVSTRPSPLAANIAAAPRRHDDDHPLWQGPCGAGPLGGITQSMLVRFMSCRERFRLKYVLGLEPPDRWNKNTGYGNMWHVCEEHHAKSPVDGQVDPSWVFHLRGHVLDMCKQYPLQGEDIAKWMNVCNVQFPEYIKYWSDHPDVHNRTPLLQEQVFDVPYQLPSGRVVRLRGKQDSVDMIVDEVTGPGGGVYLQENKSKGDIDKLDVERQLKFDLQTMLYLTALKTATSQYNTEGLHQEWIGPLEHELVMHPLLGVRYNVVRRPLSGGKGSIKPHAAKTTKTKMVPAETADEFYERLRRDYIADDPAYWFFRVRAEVSQKDIQVFRETCLDPLLEQLCWWYDEITGSLGGRLEEYSYPPMNYRTPFGVWSALEEGGSTEYDAYLASGSEAGLRRVETLFTELQ